MKKFEKIKGNRPISSKRKNEILKDLIFIEIKPIQPILKKGQIIQSSRTGKELLCYSVMSVYMGNSNEVSGYEYSFWDETKKKSQTMKSPELKKKLEGVWSIKK